MTARNIKNCFFIQYMLLKEKQLKSINYCLEEFEQGLVSCVCNIKKWLEILKISFLFNTCC